MKLHTFSVGPLATNSYLLEQEGGQGILIDPGDDGDHLSDQVHELNLTLTHILLTHAHFDHVLGLLPLTLNFPQAPIYLHPDDLFLYKQALSSATHWLGQGYSPDPPPPASSLTHELSLPSLEIIATPGHTPGSVCFYFPQDNTLFSGDTLFKSGVGRTDLSYSSPVDLADSLKRLGELPLDTLVYPGHGDSTTISQEFSG